MAVLDEQGRLRMGAISSYYYADLIHNFGTSPAPHTLTTVLYTNECSIFSIS
jgi:hypothetical protein